MPPANPGRLVRSVAAAAVVLGTTLFLAEGLIRLANPTPRVQVVRASDDLDTWMDPVAPRWKPRDHHNRDAPAADCVRARPEAPTVALVGSSILYTAGHDHPDSIGHQLQVALPRPACVFDLARPGYHHQNSVAELAAADRVFDLVIYEIWQATPNRYTVIGSSAYDLTELQTVAGYPRGPLAGPLHRGLFRRARLYEYGVLATAPEVELPVDARWTGFIEHDLHSWVTSLPRDTQVLAVVTPPLGRPLAEVRSDPGPQYRQQRRAARWLEQQGATSVDLADALADADVTAIRRDTCCHYNAQGARRVAEALAPAVATALWGP